MTPTSVKPLGTFCRIHAGLRIVEVTLRSGWIEIWFPVNGAGSKFSGNFKHSLCSGWYRENWHGSWYRLLWELKLSADWSPPAQHDPKRMTNSTIDSRRMKHEYSITARVWFRYEYRISLSHYCLHYPILCYMRLFTVPVHPYLTNTERILGNCFIVAEPKNVRLSVISFSCPISLFCSWGTSIDCWWM
jgi:hypothetical protein